MPVNEKAYAVNPLLDEFKANNPALARAYLAKGGAPTLFASGDLPPYTASGNPPSALLQLPTDLRHAAAKADQATWSRLFAEYGRNVPDGDVAMMFEPLADDEGNREYRNRFSAWKRGEKR